MNYQTRECSDACEGLHIPEWDERVGASDREVFPGFVELDADAVAGVSLQHVLKLHLGVEVDVNATLKENKIVLSCLQFQHLTQLQNHAKQRYNLNLSVCEEEKIGILIEGDLVDLELELLLVKDLVALHVDERDQVLLVADRDRLAILRPKTFNLNFPKWRPKWTSIDVEHVESEMKN